jgi:hypothetical protein
VRDGRSGRADDSLTASEGVSRGGTDPRRDVRDDERQIQPFGHVRSHDERPWRFAIVDVGRTYEVEAMPSPCPFLAPCARLVSDTCVAWWTPFVAAGTG